MKEGQHIAFKDIASALEMYKDRTALVDKFGKSYSYRDFKRHITGARADLVQRGIKKGDKVLVFVPMSLELYAILEALFSLGATAIFLDPWMKGKKMGAVIKQVQPDLFIVTRKIARISWLLPATWKLRKWKLNTIQPNDDDWQIEPVKDDDNALITFTSGTSGVPKGANRTFSFLYAQAETLKHHLKGQEDEACVDFTNFPIVGLADFAMGNTVVVPRINLMKIHKAVPSDLAGQLKESNVTRLIVSPSLLTKAIAGMNNTGEGKLQHIVTGGAPISNTLIKTCLHDFTDILFEAIYGSTEAEPICTCTFQDVADRLDQPLKGVYVGQPIDAIRLKIIAFHKGAIDAELFTKNELKDGEVGEVIVTGAHVNKNYFENPAAFKKGKITDKNGEIWHRTGDMGYLKKGHLFLVGRDHRIMTFNDKKIYPYPIEQLVEAEFGYTDVGYIQRHSGEFVFYIGQASNVDKSGIKRRIIEVGYPCDSVVVQNKPLPRDARHKSKLQTENLSN